MMSQSVTTPPELPASSTAALLDGFKNTTAEQWWSVCEHAKKVEAKYCARGNLCESEVHQCKTHNRIEVRKKSDDNQCLYSPEDRIEDWQSC